MDRPVIQRKANLKNTKVHELSNTFCYACGYCFDLMLCKNVDFIFEKLSEREQMQTKTLYNLLIYIIADYKKDDFSRLRLYCTPAGTHLLRQHTFAAYYQYILLKSPGLSVVSDPRNVLRHKQGRLTMQKLGFLFSSMYNDLSFIDNVVFCNILRSIEATLLELEEAKFTGATPVPMFTITTPGPYTHSKQSKTFHAKCNLNVNCEKKWV